VFYCQYLTNANPNVQVGFVPQDDTVHEDLTVEENLVFSALLRLPQAMSSTQKYMIVLDSLKMLQVFVHSYACLSRSMNRFFHSSDSALMFYSLCS